MSSFPFRVSSCINPEQFYNLFPVFGYMAPSTENSGREALASRSVPCMILSNGSTSSLTPPPTNIPATDTDTDPIVSSQKRFSVTGNAVVPGGAGTLGLASSYALLEHGLQGLMIFDINAANCQKEINQMKAKFPGAKIFAKTVDVTDEKAVGDAMEETARVLGSIDLLVCFVGVVGCVETLQMPVSQWRRILDINTTGSFICAQAAARHMVGQRTGGSITLVSSISAHRVNYPQPQAAYNVSKAALLMLKSCLAAEWARYGI